MSTVAVIVVVVVALGLMAMLIAGARRSRMLTPAPHSGPRSHAEESRSRDER
jgi:hypothetical protein